MLVVAADWRVHGETVVLQSPAGWLTGQTLLAPITNPAGADVGSVHSFTTAEAYRQHNKIIVIVRPGAGGMAQAGGMARCSSNDNDNGNAGSGGIA